MNLDPLFDVFRSKAVTIPPLDGAFRPNIALDEADLFAGLNQPDNLALLGKSPIVSSGNTIYSIRNGNLATVVQSFPAEVTAVAVSASGELIVGLESGVLLVDGNVVDLPPSIKCITALASDADGAIWIANGSARHTPSTWAADLMEKGASGSVWKRDAGGSFREIARNLAFPYGLHVFDGNVAVSESWRHRLLAFAVNGNRRVIVENLPGYPCRLTPADDGGAWLAMFAPRNRLIEFILQEKHYRKAMLETVPRQFWIAPSLSSGKSFLEPMQCGAIRLMGIHKPWSPTRSYGMVVKLDRRLQPVTSLHSRANGFRHGTVSALEFDGRLLVAARGADQIIAVNRIEAC